MRHLGSDARVDSAASASHYPFDNAAPQAGDRFASLAKLYDGVTRRLLIGGAFAIKRILAN